MTIRSYFDQLEAEAARKGVPLKEAFVLAGLNTSAYYRAKNGTSMNLATAEKVMQALARQSNAA